jgi:parvulin-like peptidyl-prolyl isomerase
MNAGHSPVLMKLRFLLPLLLLALLVAGCGKTAAKLGGTDIAAVSTQHITQSMFDEALSEEKASIKAAGSTVPAPGSTSFAQLKTNIINVLVERAEFALEAQKLGITVKPTEVAAELVKLKKKYFAGSDSKYKAGLKQQGFTDEQVRANLKEKLLEQKLFKSVTKGTHASDAEVQAYYAQNITQYQQPASRKVREILVGKNKETLANTIYSQLKAGGDFTALAKKYSQDPGSKDSGGNFTAQQGKDVPEFDKAVFDPASKTGTLLKPVNTAQYGWFVIQPLAAIAPAKTTSETKAAASIRKQLDATKQQQVASQWLEKTKKSYCSGGKISYQSGYTPSPDPCTALSSSTPTTT